MQDVIDEWANMEYTPCKVRIQPDKPRCDQPRKLGNPVFTYFDGHTPVLVFQPSFLSVDEICNNDYTEDHWLTPALDPYITVNKNR